MSELDTLLAKFSTLTSEYSLAAQTTKAATTDTTSRGRIRFKEAREAEKRLYEQREPVAEQIQDYYRRNPV